MATGGVQPPLQDKFDTLFSGTGVLESPTWDGAGGVYFSNVTAGGIFRADLTTREIVEVVPHRKGIGGLALTRDGELVVSGRNIAVKRGGGYTDVLLDQERLGRDVIGFNDITVSPDGGVVAGALGPGSLNPHSVDAHAPAPPAGSGTGAFVKVSKAGVQLLADDIGHPNGVAYSRTGQHVYVSDSLRRCVYRFAVEADGLWSDRTVFAQFNGALPDGMSVAEDDSLWLALALGSELVVLERDGVIRTRIPTPTALTTSVHFGGHDLRTAFIASGSHTGGEAATLLALDVPVAGIPIPKADF